MIPCFRPDIQLSHMGLNNNQYIIHMA